MDMHADSTMARNGAVPHRDVTVVRRLTAGVAALVLALATGVPLRSAEHILPDPEETATPYLGI